MIDAIRPVAPIRLYVACDGPNPERPGEAEKVAATRAVIEHEIDWPCQIERLYSEVNQGCRLGVSRAITWFFEQVEEGIIDANQPTSLRPGIRLTISVWTSPPFPPSTRS